MLKADARSASLDLVDQQINKLSYLKDDITEVAGYALKEPIVSPNLRTVMNHFGTRSAVSLGLYNVATDVERQMVENITKMTNPETGQPYDYTQAPDILERWKAGQPLGPNMDFNMEQTMWTGLHGLAGGYFAGALGGVMRAGKAGAFAEGGFGKYLADEHPAIEDFVYSAFLGIPVEAAGFTGIGYLLEQLGDKSQEGVPFSERFIHNLVTIGTLKGMHKGIDHFKNGAGRLQDHLLRDVNSRWLSKKEASNKILKTLDRENDQERKMAESTEEGMVKSRKDYEKEISDITERFREIEKIAKKIKFNKDGALSKASKKAGVTAGEVQRLEGYYRDLQKLIDTMIEEGSMVPSEVTALRENTAFDFLNKNFKDGEPADAWKVLKDELTESERLSKEPDGERKRTLLNQAKELGIKQVYNADGKLVSIKNKNLTADDIQSAVEIRKQHIKEERQHEKELKLAESGKVVTDSSVEKGQELIDSGKANLTTYGKNLVESKPVTVGAKNNKDTATAAKKILADHYGAGKAELNRMFSNLVSLDKFLQDRGKSILNVTESDVQAFLNTLRTSPTDARPKRIVKIYNSLTGEKLTKKSFDLSVGEAEAKKFKEQKKTLAPPKIKSIQTKLNNLLKKAKRIFISKERKIESDTAHFVNFLLFLTAGRIERIYGGTTKEGINKPLTAKDFIPIEGQLKKDTGGKDGYLMRVTMKGGKETYIPIFDQKIGPHDINYYQVINRIIKKNRANGVKDTESIIRGIDKQGKDIPLSRNSLVQFVKKHILGGTETLTAHDTRTAVLTMARLMDNRGVKVPGGEGNKALQGMSWLEIVDLAVVYHTPDLAKVSQAAKHYIDTALIGKDAESIALRQLAFNAFWSQARKVMNKGVASKELENVLKAIEQHQKEPAFVSKETTGKESSEEAKAAVTKKAVDKLLNVLREKPSEGKEQKYETKGDLPEVTMADAPKEMRDVLKKLKFTDEQINQMPAFIAVEFLKQREGGKEWRYDYEKQQWVDLKTGEKYQQLSLFKTPEQIKKEIRAWRKFESDSRGGAEFAIKVALKRIKQLQAELKKAQQEYVPGKEGENILTNREASTRQALEAQIAHVEKNTPGWKGSLEIVVGKEYAGKIKDGLIRLTLGKADETTVFHEVVHKLEAVIRATKNKELIKLWEKGESEVAAWARKHDSNRWDIFLRKYGKKAENEYLTQLASEWSVKRFNTKTRTGRFGLWIREMMSRFKNWIGLGSPKDIARQFGKMAEEGSFKGSDIPMKINKRQLSERDLSEPTAQERKQLHDILDRKGIKIAWDKSVLPTLLEELGLLKAGVTIDKEGNVIGGNSGQIRALTEWLTERMADPKPKLGKEWNSLNAKAHILERQRGIKRDWAMMMKRSLGIPRGTLGSATKRQITRYIDLINNFGKKYDPATVVLDQAMSEKLAKNDSEYSEIFKRIGKMALPLGYVLRKMGATKIAEKLEDHYMTENMHVGQGMVYIKSAERLIKKRGLKFIPFVREIDPETGQSMLLKPVTLENGQVVYPERPKGLDEFLENYKKPNSKERKAAEFIEEMYKNYWRTLKIYARESIKNPRLYEEWVDKIDNKYVESYFTRVLTKEAKNKLKFGSKGYQKGITDLMQKIMVIRNKDINDRIDNLEKEIYKLPGRDKKRLALEKELDKERNTLQKINEEATKEGTDTWNAINNEAHMQLQNLLRRRRNLLQNKFLMTRQPRLENIMFDDKGNQIKVWETDFSTVAGQYIRVMSNYLATVKHMPEYTDAHGDYAHASGVATSMLREIGSKSEFGEYVEKAVSRRIGMEETPLTGQWSTEKLQIASKYSALFGLSSPFSGMKNLAIGTSMTIGTHGVQAFAYGVSKLFNAKNWSEARRKGWTELGTKELELTGFGDWWMKWGSWMKPTETINRIVGGFAGEFHADRLVNVLRGDYSGMVGHALKAQIETTKSAQRKKAKMEEEIKRVGPFVYRANEQSKKDMQRAKLFGSRARKKAISALYKMFHLKPEEIAFLQQYGLDSSNVHVKGKIGEQIELNIELLRDKIGHYGHIKSQGATGDPFLPLWWGDPKPQAGTLFYRMAYSGTANVVNHIITPAVKDGNFLPMARYAFAGNLAGGALWGAYEKVIGLKPPKINEDALGQLQTNLAKAEALGLLSFVLNPYKVPGEHFANLLMADSIMQPAIIRNSIIIGDNVWNVLTNQKIDAKATLEKGAKDLVVAINHLDKFLTKQNNPLKTDVKNINTFKRAWEKSTGRYAEWQKTYNDFNRMYSANAQYYNLIKQAFLNNDLNSAARYYAATWFYLYDSKRVLSGYEQKFAKASARDTWNALDQVMDKINPMKFPSAKSSGLAFEPRTAFLDYLTPENRTIALNTEKTYHFRRRQFDRTVRDWFRKYAKKYSEGYLEKLFPLPPKNYLGSAEWKTSDTAKAGFVRY